MYWLSYGGGVNSTALAVLLATGKLLQYEPWRIIFADTGEEREETYVYIDTVFRPWLATYGKTLEIVTPPETVLERWERLKITGSTVNRSCTDHAKLRPIRRHIAEHGGGVELVGIDSGESRRCKRKVRPLVDLGVDREGCKSIILAEGLPVPVRSGCWCCPYMPVAEVLELARSSPERFGRIVDLESAATAAQGLMRSGLPRRHWGRYAAEYYQRRARGEFTVKKGRPRKGGR